MYSFLQKFCFTHCYHFLQLSSPQKLMDVFSCIDSSHQLLGEAFSIECLQFGDTDAQVGSGMIHKQVK